MEGHFKSSSIQKGTARRLVAEARPDWVIHTAAMVGVIRPIICSLIRSALDLLAPDPYANTPNAA